MPGPLPTFVTPFRSHLEPVRWALLSLHLKKSWLREGKRFTLATKPDRSRAKILSLSETTVEALSPRKHLQLGWELREEKARPVALKVWFPGLLFQNSGCEAQESVF